MEFVARLANKMDLYERVSDHLEERYIRNIGDGISFYTADVEFSLLVNTVCTQNVRRRGDTRRFLELLPTK